MAFSFDLLTGSDSAAVMGILNLSPDSFYSESYCSNAEEVFRTAEQMIKEGAHILDLGAESTRPGSKEVSIQLQLDRLLPVVSKLTIEFEIPVSVDTYKPEIGLAVLQEGAVVINDVSGLQWGNEMALIVAQYEAGLVLMHMQGKPETMQENPTYKDVVAEVLSFLRQSVKTAEMAGIRPESIAVDPGIGFGKTLKHNLELIAKLDQLKVLNKHLILGVSRKSFIGQILKLEVEDRLEGSLAAGVAGVINGANILRVHDVAATVRAIRVAEYIKEANNPK